MPFQRAGVRVERHEGIRVEVVARTVGAVKIRIGIARAPVDEVQIGVVRAGLPRGPAAARPRIDLFGPRLAARLARSGHGPEPPDLLAILRIVGVEKSANRVFSSGDAHDDLVLDDERRDGAGVALLVVGQLDVPHGLAGPGVERDEVRVERGHEQAIAVDREAAIHEAAAHLERLLRRQLILIAPELLPGSAVDGPGVVERAGRVQHAVHDEGGRLEFLSGKRHAVLEGPLRGQLSHV